MKAYLHSYAQEGVTGGLKDALKDMSVVYGFGRLEQNNMYLGKCHMTKIHIGMSSLVKALHYCRK